MEILKMKDNIFLMIKASLGDLAGEKIIDITYFPSMNDERNDGIVLLFSNDYSLKVSAFWRILYQNDMIAVYSDRYLLPTHEAPEKDFEKLPYEESLLYNNIAKINKNYLGGEIRSIDVNDVLDLSIQLKNSLWIQAFICYRNKLGLNYELYKSKQKIWGVKNEEN